MPNLTPALAKIRELLVATKPVVRVVKYLAPQEDALEIARMNAVRMLGLPENNTAMDRARALGHVDAYHGSPNSEIRQLDPSMSGKNTGNAYDVDASWATSNPKSASGYAVERALRGLMDEYGMLPDGIVSEGATVYPLMIRSGNYTVRDAGQKGNWMHHNRPALDAAVESGAPGAVIRNVRDNPAPAMRSEFADVYGIVDPSTVRSRFAAFDPARVHESGLLYAHGGLAQIRRAKNA